MQHSLIVAFSCAVNREYSGRLADSHGIDTGKLIMNEARQCGDVGNFFNVCFSVQHRLIQMGNAPTLWDIEAKDLREFCRCLRSHCVLPCAKWHQQIPVLVEGQIPMHHTGNPHG